ncbi:unnamed protein product [Amoebophrya sp. A120]|nr:unnamed protein product [Amoebophrya sp. A120]|eukprot:GSA120T00011145001.1
MLPVDEDFAASQRPFVLVQGQAAIDDLRSKLRTRALERMQTVAEIKKLGTTPEPPGGHEEESDDLQLLRRDTIKLEEVSAEILHITATFLRKVNPADASIWNLRFHTFTDLTDHLVIRGAWGWTRGQKRREEPTWRDHSDKTGDLSSARVLVVEKLCQAVQRELLVSRELLGSAKNFQSWQYRKTLLAYLGEHLLAVVVREKFNRLTMQETMDQDQQEFSLRELAERIEDLWAAVVSTELDYVHLVMNDIAFDPRCYNAFEYQRQLLLGKHTMQLLPPGRAEAEPVEGDELEHERPIGAVVDKWDHLLAEKLHGRAGATNLQDDLTCADENNADQQDEIKDEGLEKTPLRKSRSLEYMELMLFVARVGRALVRDEGSRRLKNSRKNNAEDDRRISFTEKVIETEVLKLERDLTHDFPKTINSQNLNHAGQKQKEERQFSRISFSRDHNMGMFHAAIAPPSSDNFDLYGYSNGFVSPLKISFFEKLRDELLVVDLQQAQQDEAKPNRSPDQLKEGELHDVVDKMQETLEQNLLKMDFGKFYDLTVACVVEQVNKERSFEMRGRLLRLLEHYDSCVGGVRVTSGGGPRSAPP